MSNLSSLKYLTLVVLILSSVSGFSQSSQNALTISLGSGFEIISFSDKSSSPLVYSGFGLPISLIADFNSKKWRHQINISAISETISNNYPLRSNANTQLVTWEKARVNYTLFHRFKNGFNYFGGSLYSMFFYREYDFLDGQSYEFINSLNATYGRIISNKDPYRLEATISLPLLGWIHRKPSLTLDEAFLDDFHNEGNLLKYGVWKTIFGNWFGFDLNIRGCFEISEELSLTSEIGLNYYSIQFPEKTTSLSYPILCYVNYRF